MDIKGYSLICLKHCHFLRLEIKTPKEHVTMFSKGIMPPFLFWCFQSTKFINIVCKDCSFIFLRYCLLWRFEVETNVVRFWVDEKN
jgi:hypothetical protein